MWKNVDGKCEHRSLALFRAVTAKRKNNEFFNKRKAKKKQIKKICKYCDLKDTKQTNSVLSFEL